MGEPSRTPGGDRHARCDLPAAFHPLSRLAARRLRPEVMRLKQGRGGALIGAASYVGTDSADFGNGRGRGFSGDRALDAASSTAPA